jgi:hypothetical protein
MGPADPAGQPAANRSPAEIPHQRARRQNLLGPVAQFIYASFRKRWALHVLALARIGVYQGLFVERHPVAIHQARGVPHVGGGVARMRVDQDGVRWNRKSRHQIPLHLDGFGEFGLRRMHEASRHQ